MEPVEMAASVEINPLLLALEDATLTDLSRRLAATRWPPRETVPDWSQGVPVDYLRDFCEYWLDEYDWRRTEARLNELPNFRAAIDGLEIHFIHVRSPHVEATPLILTHGWPGSVLEFIKAIGPLTDPVAHGGDAADAFHVVCPAMPGFGFSDKPAGIGWGVHRIAAAWKQLMAALGYERYFAQGGDWGATVSTVLAELDREHVAGIHLNYAVLSRQAFRELGDLEPDEEAAMAAQTEHQKDGGGYSVQQATRPQTLGYGLADSPAAQCAWILEKFMKWSECDGDPVNAFSRDELLDNVMIYWLCNAGASSARIYWESSSVVRGAIEPVSVPTAFSAFPFEIVCYPERWVETRYKDLRYYNRPARGGHFAAFEQPGLFVDEVRAGIAALGR
jgi:pimeloyl-ACP methyl ester carboxylesterase